MVSDWQLIANMQLLMNSGIQKNLFFIVVTKIVNLLIGGGFL